MYLQKETAKKIIKEISTVLDYDINIMNEDGIILASTAMDRVDSFHEAAYKIIRESLPELMVYFDGEYKGCKKGINLPILLEGNIIGAIGMTGDVEEITKYGRILKKMTEIMLLDTLTLYQQNVRTQRKLLLFNEIINSTVPTDETILQLKKYDLIDLAPSTAFLFQPNDLLDRHPIQHTIATNMGDIGAAVSQLPPEILKQQLREITEAEAGAKVFAGSTQDSLIHIKQSFEEAEKAEEYHDNHESHRLVLYDDFLIDIILDRTPKNDKKKCIAKIFKDCSKAEIDEYSKFIHVYSNHNGSINKTATSLFIHKNTVQYKINKIQNRTGLDMRNSEDLFKLKLAVKWLIS